MSTKCCILSSCFHCLAHRVLFLCQRGVRSPLSSGFIAHFCSLGNQIILLAITLADLISTTTLKSVQLPGCFKGASYLMRCYHGNDCCFKHEWRSSECKMVHTMTRSSRNIIVFKCPSERYSMSKSFIHILLTKIKKFSPI